jgi:hypothetical protein
MTVSSYYLHMKKHKPFPLYIPQAIRYASMLRGFYTTLSTASSRLPAKDRLTLVNIGLGVMRLLVLLVDDRILGRAGTGAHLRIRVLGHLLVGLLGALGTGALDGLGNVVGGVLDYSVSDDASK